jgi:hypothetical protein
VAVLLFAMAASVFSAEAESPVENEAAPAAETERGAIHAVIVSGMCREERQLASQQNSLAVLRMFLSRRAGVDKDNIHMLDSNPDFALKPADPASAPAVSSAIGRAISKMKPGDTLLFYYCGQANLVGGKLRFNLPGPDLTHEELGEALAVPEECRGLFVLDCPNAGMAIETTSGKNRIVICGARGDQPYSTQFSQFFVPALSDEKSDFDSDGRVSLLDAYRRAVVTIDELYRGEGRVKTENALLEDDGDGVPTHMPWEHTEDAYDGAAAANFFLKADEKE